VHTSNSSQVQEKKGKEDVDPTKKKKVMVSRQRKDLKETQATLNI